MRRRNNWSCEREGEGGNMREKGGVPRGLGVDEKVEWGTHG